LDRIIPFSSIGNDRKRLEDLCRSLIFAGIEIIEGRFVFFISVGAVKQCLKLGLAGRKGQSSQCGKQKDS
jgi:hypothetical protein